MPKPKHAIEEKYLEHLKKDIQAIIGMMVLNRPDADRFSKLIRETKGVYISASTISRLFIDKQKENHFYIDTLNKLSTITQPQLNWQLYCENCQNAEDQLKHIGVFNQNKVSTNLIALNFYHRSWKPLHDVFDNLSSDPQFSDSFRFMFEFGHMFYSIFQWSPQSEIDFYKRFIKYPIIRKSFFELNADPDFVLPHYIKGLNNYIKTIDKKSSSYINDLLFALCLQFYYSIKNKDLIQVKSKFNQIQSVIEIDDLLKYSIHPFNCGRYLSSYIYYSFHADNNRFNSSIDSAINWLKTNAEIIGSYGVRVVTYHLLEAMLTCKADEFYFDELVFYSQLDSEFASNPLLVKQAIFHMEPSTIRWTRRFNKLQ